LRTEERPMQVTCPNCGNVVTVPPDKVGRPNLKARCRCGSVFAVTAENTSEDPPPLPTRDAPSPSTGVVRHAAATADRVAEIRAANLRAAAAFAATAPGGPDALKKAPPPARSPLAPAGVQVRTAPSMPRAAAGAPATATTPAAGPAADAKTGRPHSVRVPWRRCQNHPQTRAEQVCPKCVRGYCEACAQKVQTATICPACESLCVAAAAYEEAQDKAKQRARSMMDEIPVIAAYPLNDRLAFVMLVVFTGFFGLFRGFGPIMTVLSTGVLTWYSFNAVSKVAIGNMRDVMPDFRDVSDITDALKLSLAALVVSAGPFFALIFLVPGAAVLTGGRSLGEGPRLEAVHAQPPASPTDEDADEKEKAGEAGHERPHSAFEADREGGSVLGPLAMLAIVLAVIWMVVYMPVALMVAALSKSIVSTLNPLIGIDTIRKMGPVYWQAMAFYVAIVVAEAVIGLVLGLIPIAGALVKAVVDAYAALAIGCTLGMAVFKKAADLGWD
jgi:hypothetical protein